MVPHLAYTVDIVIDLHTHSSCSDGSDSPSELIDLAADAGCEALALTDHDTVAGVAEATLRASERGIEMIAGVELSCHTSTRNIHILGYFVDPTNVLFLKRLQSQQTLRLDRNLRLVERLAELNMPISFEDVVGIAGGGSIGRPHFAAILMRHGYVESIDEAFVRFLSDGAPAYVERQELSAEVAIKWISDAGGVASWAHPVWRSNSGSSKRPSIDSVVEELATYGLIGIEALYSRYDSDQRKQLRKLAERYGLVATGGSDYHGTYKPDLTIGSGAGDLNLPYSIISALRQQIPH